MLTMPSHSLFELTIHELDILVTNFYKMHICKKILLHATISVNIDMNVLILVLNNYLSQMETSN